MNPGLTSSKANLTPSTIRTRLSMIARWHTQRGLVDPTKAPEIKAMMKGLRSHYQKAPKKARPLGFSELKSIIEGLHCTPNQALVFEDQPKNRS
ncbi:MAG: hypothetical protein JKY67_19375 [Pseudomonadales bacterium]|nr:hypothetical protein [Pseudomonadales bacterium]